METMTDDDWRKEHWPARCPDWKCHPGNVMELNATSHGCERWHCPVCDGYFIRWLPVRGCARPALIPGKDFAGHVATVARPPALPIGPVYDAADAIAALGIPRPNATFRTRRTTSGDTIVEDVYEAPPWNLDADLREKLAGASGPNWNSWDEPYTADLSSAAESLDELRRSGYWLRQVPYKHETADQKQAMRAAGMSVAPDERPDVDIGRALCAADNQRILESPRYLAPPTVAPPGSKFGRPIGPDADFARLPPRRPDGFDQARIDEIKAALLATGRKR